MTITLRIAFVLSLLVVYAAVVQAQVVTGTPPFGSFSGSPDVVDLANLNSHLTMPVFNKSGRGIPFSYSLTYDSSVWYPVTSGSTTTWQPVSYWGWGVQTAMTTGYATYQILLEDCRPLGVREELYDWTYVDQFGVPHAFSGHTLLETGSCGSAAEGLTAVSADGSGYTLNATDGGQATITSRGGEIFTPPVQSAAGAGGIEDTNGNEISVSSSGVFTDTLGTTALTIAVRARRLAPSP
jgi:hypothetical protein